MLSVKVNILIFNNQLECSYKCDTCENQAEKCLSCPLNSSRILDSVKGCFCPGEFYDKEDEFVCQSNFHTYLKDAISNINLVMERAMITVSLVILLLIEN